MLERYVKKPGAYAAPGSTNKAGKEAQVKVSIDRDYIVAASDGHSSTGAICACELQLTARWGIGAFCAGSIKHQRLYGGDCDITIVWVVYTTGNYVTAGSIAGNGIIGQLMHLAIGANIAYKDSE